MSCESKNNKIVGIENLRKTASKHFNGRCIAKSQFGINYSLAAVLLITSHVMF